jgi:hypothetical protein
MREVKKNCIMGIEDTRNMTITNTFLMTTKMFALSFTQLTAVLLAESVRVMERSVEILRDTMW